MIKTKSFRTDLKVNSTDFICLTSCSFVLFVYLFLSCFILFCSVWFIIQGIAMQHSLSLNLKSSHLSLLRVGTNLYIPTPQAFRRRSLAALMKTGILKSRLLLEISKW